MMLLNVILIASSLSAGNAEFETTAVASAAEISLKRLREEAVAVPPEEGVLKAAMLSGGELYVTRESAAAAAEPVYREAVAKRYNEAAAAVYRRLGIQEEPAKLDEEALDRAVKDGFGGAFDRERQQALEAQAKEIALATRPSEAEIESHDDNELKRMMLERVVREQKIPVFEENYGYIKESVVGPVIEDARREQKRQTEYLMRARSDAYGPSALAADLRRRLETNVKERQAKAESPLKAWGVFPGVTNEALTAAVERRTVERLERQVGETELKVTTEEIAAVIKENPAQHVKKEESEKLFRDRYAQALIAGAVEKTVAEAPAAERQELREFLSGRLDNAGLAKSVDAKLKKDILPEWKAARQVCAEQLMAATWPTLEDGTWYPSAELADATAASSDYSARVKGWRQAGELKELAGASGGKPVMEETASAADERVAHAFDVARNAIAAQNALVDEVHPAVLKDSIDRKESFFRRTPDLKAITASLTKATEEAWNERRLQTLWPEGEAPANASEQHAGLFPSVRKKIELVAKSILEEMNSPKPEEKNPEEPPPEEEPPEDTPPEETPPEEEVPLFAIEVQRTGDRVEVKLLQGKSAVVERTTDAKQSEFEGAMKEVTEKLGRDLLKLR